MAETIVNMTNGGDVQGVQSLLDNRASPSTRDCQGRTLLHLACHAGNIDLATILLDADPMLVDLEAGPESLCPNWLPIHSAADCNQGGLRLVRLLLERRSSVDEDFFLLASTTSTPFTLTDGEILKLYALRDPADPPMTDTKEIGE
jgi:ankyrin repeat protein